MSSAWSVTVFIGTLRLIKTCPTARVIGTPCRPDCPLQVDRFEVRVFCSTMIVRQNISRVALCKRRAAIAPVNGCRQVVGRLASVASQVYQSRPERPDYIEKYQEKLERKARE